MPFAQQDMATWKRTIESNILGVGYVTHQFLRHNFAVVGGSPDGTTPGKNKEALHNVSVITTTSIGSFDYLLPGLVSTVPHFSDLYHFTKVPLI
jgi:hypothetical protein